MWYVARVHSGGRIAWGFGRTLREAELEALRYEDWWLGCHGDPLAVLSWSEPVILGREG